MQITSRFTIAVHIIAFVDYFGEECQVTSRMMAGSINANPVIIRGLISYLNEAGLLRSKRGVKGIHLAKPLSEISLYDVYQAVDCIEEEGMFCFHKNPNEECPVGRNIQQILNPRLQEVQQSMEEELKRNSLADIMEELRMRVAEET